MALSTYNKFGHITVSDEAVAIIVSKAASECYGVVELVSRRFSDNLAKIFNKKTYGKGVMHMKDQLTPPDILSSKY